MNRIVRTVALLFLAGFAAAIPAFGTVAGWNGSDSFAGTILNSCNWDDISFDGVVSQNDELILSTRGDRSYSDAELATQYTLIGDFDLSVDYRIMAGWDDPIVAAGENAHINVAVSLFLGGGARRLVMLHSRDSGGEFLGIYTNIPGLEQHNGVHIPIRTRSGSYRLTRSGARTTLRYHDGTSWRDVAFVDEIREPVYVSLSATSVNARNAFSAAFDNFSLLSATTSSRPFARKDSYRSRSDFRVGGVVTDFLAHRTWGQDWQRVHPLDKMKENGFEWVRVGVLTTSSQLLKTTPVSQWRALGWKDEYWSSFEFAAEILRQAAERGFRLDLFFFLSDRAADAGRQSPPPAWATLGVDATAAELERYTSDTASQFRARGLPIELYDMGNEIDFGILGFRPGERIPVPPGIDFTHDLDWMRQNVWNVEATLLKGAIRGVRRADPNGKIVLHIAGSYGVGEGNAFALGFFRTMVDAGVDFDYAGISHPYPSVPWKLDRYSTDCWFQRLQELVDGIAALGKKTIVSEAAYPSNSAGTIARPMMEFPYSLSGQAAWTREQLRFASHDENIVGWFWFYPDYFPGVGTNTPLDLQYQGLFQSELEPDPAMAEFRANLGKISASADNDPTAAQRVLFRATLAGAVVARSYRWDFGDGTSSSEQNPRHAYASPGTYDWSVVIDTTVGPLSAGGKVNVTAARRRAVRPE